MVQRIAVSLVFASLLSCYSLLATFSSFAFHASPLPPLNPKIENSLILLHESLSPLYSFHLSQESDVLSQISLFRELLFSQALFDKGSSLPLNLHLVFPSTTSFHNRPFTLQSASPPSFETLSNPLSCPSKSFFSCTFSSLSLNLTPLSPKSVDKTSLDKAPSWFPPLKNPLKNFLETPTLSFNIPSIIHEKTLSIDDIPPSLPYISCFSPTQNLISCPFVLSKRLLLTFFVSSLSLEKAPKLEKQSPLHIEEISLLPEGSLCAIHIPHHIIQIPLFKPKLHLISIPLHRGPKKENVSISQPLVLKKSQESLLGAQNGTFHLSLHEVSYLKYIFLPQIETSLPLEYFSPFTCRSITCNHPCLEYSLLSLPQKSDFSLTYLIRNNDDLVHPTSTLTSYSSMTSLVHHQPPLLTLTPISLMPQNDSLLFLNSQIDLLEIKKADRGKVILSLFPPILKTSLQLDVDEHIPLLVTYPLPSEHLYVHEDIKSINRTHRDIEGNLIAIPSLDDLLTESLDDHFTIETRVLKCKDNPGYYLSLNVKEKDKESSPLMTLSHRLYFLLDATSSLQKERFEMYKKGICQAVQYLSEGTLFNIIVLKDHPEKLFQHDLSSKNSSLLEVKRALENVKPSKTISFSTLGYLLCDLDQESKDHHILTSLFFLSNGLLLKNIHYNQKPFADLIHSQLDNLMLYACAMSDDNNLAMLDLLSKILHGECLFSETHAAFPRKLAHFVKQIQKPLITDIRIYPVDPQENLDFIHNADFAPPFFHNKPYRFLGSIDALKKVSVIIQGRSQGLWLNIHKTLLLNDTNRARASLEKEFMKKRAFNHIIKFLLTTDAHELVEAQRILIP